MKNTKPLIQKQAASFAVMLAVALTASCQPAKGQASTNAAAAAPAAPASRPGYQCRLFDPARSHQTRCHGKMDRCRGNVWLPDQGSTDGETYEATDAAVTNTPNPALYQTERYSMTAYNFAVPNGKYTVKLHFAGSFQASAGRATGFSRLMSRGLTSRILTSG